VALGAPGIPGLTRLTLDARLAPLVLASASPRRAALLSGAGLVFERAAADVDETPRPGERAQETCLRLAQDKARATAAGRRRGTILAGDTLVVLDGRPLGKPADAREARAMLAALSGREHEVFSSAAALRLADGRLVAGLSRSRVAFDALDEATLSEYLASGEWEGKAGSYAIQGSAGRFAHLVEGELDTVIGLHLELVARLLGRLAEDAP
jgi:nucleoside triphosphate pyrophosphatase